MSTAFRNFIITFALAVALFAVVGYLAVNGVLDGLFKGGETVSTDTTEYSYENTESYYDGEYAGSEDEVPSTKDFGDFYVVFYEDHLDNLTEVKILCVNEETGKVVFEEVPLNSTIVVNGYNRTVSDIYKTNGESYLCGKLGYVFGVSVKGYMTFDTEAMLSFFTLTTLCEEYELEIECNLPYEVKYEDPEMKDYNEQNPDDIQYVTLAGDAVITAENATAIFENVPEDTYDSKAASLMFSQIYDTVFKTVFAKTEIRDTDLSVADFFRCFEKINIEAGQQKIFFVIYDGLHEVSGLPELESMAGKELNWSTLPSVFEAAMK